MASTDNPQFICPLHVGDCIGGVLTKFIDFSPSLYPDSLVAVAPDTSEPKGAAKPKAAQVPQRSTRNDGNYRHFDFKNCNYVAYYII